MGSYMESLHLKEENCIYSLISISQMKLKKDKTLLKKFYNVLT